MIPSVVLSSSLKRSVNRPQVSTNVQVPARQSPRQSGMYVISPGAQCSVFTPFLQPGFAELVPPHLQLTPDVT